MIPTRTSCATCPFAVEIKDLMRPGEGLCHRNPPQPVGVYGAGVMSVRPRVQLASDWCGEHPELRREKPGERRRRD